MGSHKSKKRRVQPHSGVLRAQINIGVKKRRNASSPDVRDNAVEQ